MQFFVDPDMMVDAISLYTYIAIRTEFVISGMLALQFGLSK